MQRIKNSSLYLVILLFILLALPTLAEPTLENGIATETMEGIKAKRHAEKNSLYKGRKHVKFEKARYDVLIDLRSVESARVIVNGTQKSKSLTIEQLDEIYLKLAEHLPAGIDFSIGRKSLKNNKTALITLHLTKDAPELEFKGIGLVLGVSPASHEGFYLGRQKVNALRDYFHLPTNWTKETGLNAIEQALDNGAFYIEATIVFREKHRIELGVNNPYFEVINQLREKGGLEEVLVLDDLTTIFSYKIKRRDIDYLRSHPSVSNVVPFLREPK